MSWIAAALVLCLIGVALAFNFPPLTGRVVDQANIITAQSRSDLETKLKDLENKSGIQLVVATVKSLEGSDIETYANELFRNWKLGEAKKNNGVLLLVAPNEHKVRIEVGYGLEGTLTDALSSVIISSAIVPRFKANDFTGGIERGVDGIISVLSGDTADWQPKPSVRRRRFSRRCPMSFFRSCSSWSWFSWCWSLIRGGGGTSSGRSARRGGGMIFLPTGGSTLGRRGLEVEAAGLVAAFPAAAVGRAAAARRGAGDGVHQGGSRSRLGSDTRGGKAHLRTDRLRARPFVLRLRICPDPVGECACALRSVAVD